MATIKMCTDISQSKVFGKILPLESADMRYHTISHYNPYPCDEIIYTVEFDKASGKDIPCWGLAALLGVLPYCPDLSKHTDGKWYITTYPNDVHTCLMAYDNPVDACVEMIEKLNELKML